MSRNNSTTPTETETVAINALLDLLERELREGNGARVRQVANSIAGILSDYYYPNDEEAKKCPPVDIAALRQSLSDYTTLAIFAANNPRLAGTKSDYTGIAYQASCKRNELHSEINTISSWRSPEQVAKDEERYAQYRAEQAEKKRLEEAAKEQPAN